MVQSLGYGLDDPDFESLAGVRYFFTKHLGRLWDPPSLLCNGYRGLSRVESGQSVNLSTHLHLVQNISMSGPFPPLSIYTPSCCGQGQLYLLLLMQLGASLSSQRNCFNTRSLCVGFVVHKLALVLPSLLVLLFLLF